MNTIKIKLFLPMLFTVLAISCFVTGNTKPKPKSKTTTTTTAKQNNKKGKQLLKNKKEIQEEKNIY